jgi:hypothetical protein
VTINFTPRSGDVQQASEAATSIQRREERLDSSLPLIEIPGTPVGASMD